MDFLKMMKQAKQMQEQMGSLQEEIAEIEAEGSAGGGMVSVKVGGKGELRAVKIDPSMFKEEDVEILEDLIIAAHNEAKAKVEQAMQEKTQEMMSGLGLPAGMKLPF
ncbi:YbaB/EbfC family nucleoid-associated protein [Roseibium sp.]|uniref:YbaB/EbfC family nucleoid-associated protein n=1 Tax=Roseibium sp. TaxID=1936156 RepID=UPI003A96E522